MPGIPAIAPYALPTAGEVPANIAPWSIDWEQAVLLVHDMQRFFLKPLPPLPREDLVRNAAALLAHGRAHRVPVAYTAQPGGMSERERGLLRDFWGPGMAAAPADRRVVAELAPVPGDIVFTKWRYSAFHRTGLLRWMREKRRNQLVICGVYAHIGVLATAVDAFTHDIRTFIVADAVADFSAEHHLLALRYAATRCAVTVAVKELTA